VWLVFYVAKHKKGLQQQGEDFIAKSHSSSLFLGKKLSYVQQIRSSST
jgi:hypothetical protein